MTTDYYQPPFYKFNEDSLHLSKFIRECLNAPDLGHTLEVGIGCGIISIEVLKSVSSLKGLNAYEKEESFKESLEKNVELFIQKRGTPFKRENIEIRYEDFLSSNKERDALYDLIYFNPPYFFEGDGRKSPDLKKEGCRRMKRSHFIEWLKTSAALLKNGGDLFFCHRLNEWSPEDFNMRLEKIDSSDGAFYFHWKK